MAGRLESISRQITKVPGVTTSFFTPDIANHVPHMQIIWDPARIALTPHQVAQALRNSKPAIVISAGEDRPGLAMNSFMLQPGETRLLPRSWRRCSVNTRASRTIAERFHTRSAIQPSDNP